MTFAERVEAFRATANNPQDRADYAASRADVINPLLDEQSTIRAIFEPEQLAPGADARWDIPSEDIECTIVMPNIGAVPTVQFEGKELHVDTFGISGGVDYQIDIAKDGRFQVAQVATNVLKNHIIRQEEMSGWALIKTHASVLPSTQKMRAYKNDGTAIASSGVTAGANEGKLNIYTLNVLLTLADGLGIGGRQISDIYCSPRRFGDLRDQVTIDKLPPNMRERLYGNGATPSSGVPEIRIHRVYNSNLVTDKKGYAFTQKDGWKYGKMPIREQLNTRDNPISILEWKIGIMARERLGFGVFDDKGLIEITFID